MNRRSFFATALAPLVAQTTTIANTLGPRRKWTHVCWTGWKSCMDWETGEAWLAAQLIGQRSDKQWFFVTARLPGYSNPSREEMRSKRIQARYSLDGFLGCDCVSGRPCKEHAL